MLIILFFILAGLDFIEGNPIVSTRYGKIEGFWLDLEDGSRADIFLGVPFASPPIDELRFEVKGVEKDFW